MPTKFYVIKPYVHDGTFLGPSSLSETDQCRATFNARHWPISSRSENSDRDLSSWTSSFKSKKWRRNATQVFHELNRNRPNRVN